MDDGTFLAVALSVAVGYLGASVTQRQKDQSRNVTGERKVWRNEMRGYAAEITKFTYIVRTDEARKESVSRLRLIHTELRVRLNPSDRIDREILTSVSNLIEHLKSSEYEDAIDVHDGIILNLSQLLKHDWERVKEENSQKSIWKMSKWIRTFFSKERKYDRTSIDNSSSLFFVSAKELFLVLSSVFSAYIFIRCLLFFDSIFWGHFFAFIK
ncbi:hypothetical protein [Desulfovibrio sp. JC022]|uniref:hypothetical protein n=1 Tax=Desulfovibrio sp. JC022 TaxID=2593642 RepID=UPI0013D42B27|nr:hypothetical protein [Desulfovibrio sp. JC022]NDV22966.1 hypothetical protein [Desulfovibrio sp. JC022]